MNEEKTEYTEIKREKKKEDEQWRKAKKVGSLLGDEEDMGRRRTLAAAAMGKMNKIWIRKDKISQKRKINLYRALVKSILMYNCGTWGVTKTEEEKMDAFHRKQLRRVMGVKYPTKISNTKLYSKTGEKPISETMRRSRWKLLGHILRRDQQIPANMAMNLYFNEDIRGGKKFRGARRTTLPTVLNTDLSRIQHRDHNYCRQIKLANTEDLKNLQQLAVDRKFWRCLVARVVGAGRAESSVDDSAEAP